MTDRPAPLKLLDHHFAVSGILHAYAFDLYRELLKLGCHDDRAHQLVQESALVTLERMPELARELRSLEFEWAGQELLDPPAAGRTLDRLADLLAGLAPEFAALRARQDQIIAELLDLVRRSGDVR
jgi:hypothetical protein